MPDLDLPLPMHFFKDRVQEFERIFNDDKNNDDNNHNEPL